MRSTISSRIADTASPVGTIEESTSAGAFSGVLLGSASFNPITASLITVATMSLANFEMKSKGKAAFSAGSLAGGAMAGGIATLISGFFASRSFGRCASRALSLAACACASSAALARWRRSLLCERTCSSACAPGVAAARFNAASYSANSSSSRSLPRACRNQAEPRSSTCGSGHTAG